MVEYEDKAIPLLKEWWKKFEEAGLADIFTDVHASVWKDDENQEFIIYAYFERSAYMDNTVIHTGIKADIETYVDLKRR